MSKMDGNIDLFINYLFHIFTNHSAIYYLLNKVEAKLRLIRWILLLQEFDIKIKDEKGTSNVVANHLFKLTQDQGVISKEEIPINDPFPDEHLLVLIKIPWYADIENYLAYGIMPSDLSYQ